MFRDVFSRHLVGVALMALVLASSVYAGEAIEVIDPQSSTGETFAVGVMEEGGKFYHDRQYIIQDIPEQYLGLTNITTSADTVGDVNVEWTFEIGVPAYVYIGFDERWQPPEERDQEPGDWFNDAYTKTEESVVLGPPHQPTHYWLYKSNEPYPAGEVTLHGLGQGGGDGTYRIIFVEQADLAVSSQEKLTGKWGEIKSHR